METLGIVGLPNSGKSTLFNALTGMTVDVGAHPFTTTGSNVGVAQVPDQRLQTLSKLSQSQKTMPAGLNVTDIAGLVAGAASGEGLGNRFLAQIRDVDAILFCLRAFVDDSVVYAIDPPDPLVDLETLETELCIADLDTVEARLPKTRKSSTADAKLVPFVKAMEAAVAALGEGIPIYRSNLTDDEKRVLHDLFLLTNKNALYVVNVGEDDLGAERQGVIEKKFIDAVGGTVDAGQVAAVCVELEAEIAQIGDESEREELLASYGVEEPALARVARAAYYALGKEAFFTTGEKETRAWTIPAGATAKTAAGAIHSDLERGFIRAEVIAYDDAVAAGGWDEAKKAGHMRLEGKDYVVKDGDVLVIRFNV